jgi:outer membrane protein assembly factor BamB
VAVSFALQGCSLFSSEEDLNPMAPLPKVESAFTADTAWSSSVGDGIGDFYSQLKPVVEEDRIYAAARDGDVTAFERESARSCGAWIWQICPSTPTSAVPVSPVVWSLATASCSSGPKTGWSTP